MELFHEIAGADSAAARLLVMELGLKKRVSFRNVADPDAARDHAARGGGPLPALWDGERLHPGLDAVRIVLSRM